MMALPMAALFEIFAAGYRGAGDMRTPLVLGAIVNVFNVLANYVLIFGHLGFPALGVRGCGIGTALAFAVGAGLAGVVLRRKKSALRLTGAALRPDGQLTKRVVRIGLPAAVEQLFLQVGFVLYLRTAAHYGTEAIGAYFIGVRILALCFLPGLGFSTAASTIVGQSLGAGAADEAEAGGWEAARLSVSLMSFGGLFIFLGAEFIARAFVNDPAVIGAAVPFIRTLAVAQPLMALDFTLGGSLRGAGDTRFPLWSLIFGFYAIRLGFAYSAAFVLDLGLNWVWLALLGDYLARSLLKAWRFRSGAWRTVQV
jgi:putative MATE family efflux protein